MTFPLSPREFTSPGASRLADARANRGATDAGLVIPTVVETSMRGERAYDLFSRLLHERIILVNGPIEDQLSNLVVAELLFLASQGEEREINMYINSPGGVITAGMAIYDTMRSLRCPISTTAIGLAASFGTMLLMAGDPGRRYALPNARIHLHQPLLSGGGLGGQVTDIDIHARELLHTRANLQEIIAFHTGQPLDRVIRDTERDFYMSADAAKEYGIIDDVLPLEDWQSRRKA